MNVKALLNQYLLGSHTSRWTENENICIMLSSQRTSCPVLMAVGRGWALQLPPPSSGSRGRERQHHLSSSEAPVGTAPQVPPHAWHAAAPPGSAPAALVMAACTPSAHSSLFNLDSEVQCEGITASQPPPLLCTWLAHPHACHLTCKRAQEVEMLRPGCQHARGSLDGERLCNDSTN